MAYLRLRDYIKSIQTENLNQIITSDSSIRISAELAAQAEVISYLTQKYEVDEEFRNTEVFSMTKIYKANDLVYLDATAYSAASTYALKSLTLQAGKVYVCIVAIVAPEAFNASKWTLLGAQYDLFFITLPKPEFDITKVYKTGDQVYWKNKTYTNLIASSVLDHNASLQFGTYSDIPLGNVFPDDPIGGVKSWGAGTSYTVAVETLPTDTAKWTAGDNRSQQVLMYMIDIALYHLHSRIAPRNIPELRIDRYDSSIAWLKMAGRGEITADIPKRQPKQGARIRFGGSVKNVNSY